MKHIWAMTALCGLVLLAACGAADPPAAEGGIDLTTFWGG